MSSPPNHKKTEMKKSSASPLSLLPEDILLLCLARLPRSYHPTLSLVSKYFRSLVASPELEATRSRNGITEDYLYVCLEIDKENPEPRWFTVSLIPEERKLRPIPPFPHQHPKFATVLSMGSEIYIIGGLIDGRRSSRVVSLDCRSYQWRILPNMRQARETPAAEVIDGKIFVIGGSMSNEIEDWGEVYDPKTQTWGEVLPTTLDLTAQKSVFPGELVMDGKVYAMDNDLKINLEKDICIIEKGLLLGFAYYWNDPEQDVMWRTVKGLDELCLCYEHSMAKSGGGRVTMWWKSVERRPGVRRCTKDCKTEIWCAEVSFERRGLEELRGSVEWSKNMFTIEGSCDSRPDFFLHSAIISH